jgi:hypothetical protein
LHPPPIFLAKSPQGLHVQHRRERPYSARMQSGKAMTA